MLLPPVHIYMHVLRTYTWLLDVSFRFVVILLLQGWSSCGKLHTKFLLFFFSFFVVFSLKENKIYIFIYMFNYNDNNNNNNNCMEDVKRKI